MLTYRESSEIRIARILSIWPTNFPDRFPERGSHSLITRSGDPDAIVWPNGSAASAYIDALAAEASGGLRVISGVGDDWPTDLFKSHSLIVRSKEPEAIQFCSGLHGRSRSEFEQNGVL
jgi:hypothetical protein